MESQGRTGWQRLVCLAAVVTAVPIGCSAIPPATTEPSPSPSATASVTSPASQTASPTVTPATSPTGSLTATASATTGPSLTNAPTTTAPSPTLSPSSGGWTAPLHLGGGGTFGLSIAVDPSGHPHIATSYAVGVVHRTNAGGAWEVEEIARYQDPHGYGYPDIAMDADGSMAIAYNRLDDLGELGLFPSGTFVTTNAGDGWSDGKLVEDATERASVALRDGTVHAAFSQATGWELDCEFPPALRYATVTADAISVQTVSEDGGRGLLALAPDGMPRIMFGTACPGADTAPVWYAVGSSEGFVVEPVPGLLGQDNAIDMATGVDGTVHLLFRRMTTVGYLALASDGLTPTVQLMPDADAAALAVDDQGGVHVVAFVDGALLYAAGRDGNFVVALEPIPLAQVSPDSLVDIAVVVDRAGRPHVVYASDHPQSGVFYLIGPGY